MLDNKVRKITDYLFDRFDMRRAEKVTFDEFNDAIMDDPQLLEIFTLLNKGIYENFITKTVEEGRRHWFMNQTKYISMSLTECLTTLDNQEAAPNFREAVRQYTSQVPSFNKVAMSPPEQDLLNLKKARSITSFVDMSEKGAMLVTPLQNSISCTPALYVDADKQKSRKYKKLDPNSMYDANPIQEIEIIAEEVRVDQILRGQNGSKRHVSPEHQSNQYQQGQGLPKSINLNPITVDEIEGMRDITKTIARTLSSWALSERMLT
jgi:hypothetical protein